MKHLFAIMLICSLGLVGCGEKTPAPKPDTPGEVVEKFAYAMQDGDADLVKELCPDFADNLDDEELEDLIGRLATNALNNGGIATITIEEETIDGDKATVTAKLTNGSGLTDTETFDLNKKGDKWVIDMSDIFDKLGTTGFDGGGGAAGEPEEPEGSGEAESTQPAG